MLNLNQIAQDLSLDDTNTTVFLEEVKNLQGFSLLQLQNGLTSLHESDMYTDPIHTNHAASIAISVVIQDAMNNKPVPVVEDIPVDEVAVRREALLVKIDQLESDGKTHQAASLRDAHIQEEQARVSAHSRHELFVEEGVASMEKIDAAHAEESGLFAEQLYTAKMHDLQKAGISFQEARITAAAETGYQPAPHPSEAAIPPSPPITSTPSSEGTKVISGLSTA